MRSAKLFIVVFGAVLATAAPASAQWLDPDHCWRCRDKREHFAAGAGLDLLARGPWVARSFRNTWWKRVALTTVVAASWELLEAGEARREGKAGRPGYGFGPVDLVMTVAGAATFEVMSSVARRIARH